MHEMQAPEFSREARMAMRQVTTYDNGPAEVTSPQYLCENHPERAGVNHHVRPYKGKTMATYYLCDECEANFCE